MCSLLSTPILASKPDSVPDWVRTAAQQALPSYPPETNAVVLLEDITYTVAPDGSAVEHYRHVVKILRPQGRDEGIVGRPLRQGQQNSLHARLEHRTRRP